MSASVAITVGFGIVALVLIAARIIAWVAMSELDELDELEAEARVMRQFDRQK